MRAISLAVALVAVLVAKRAAAEDLRLLWWAPAGCPTREHVRDAALKSAGKGGVEPLDAEVRIEQGERWRVTIRSSRNGTAAEERTVEGASCAAVADATSDILAIAMIPPGKSLRTWLFGITLRVVRDHRRSARRRDPGPPVDPDMLRDTGGGPAESAEKAEAVRLLHDLLDELDDERREVFVMAELEQMAMPEISEALAINVNTAYARARHVEAPVTDLGPDAQSSRAARRRPAPGRVGSRGRVGSKRAGPREERWRASACSNS